jgi:glycosyltransferase involved in cell wall biosynthesis
MRPVAVAEVDLAAPLGDVDVPGYDACEVLAWDGDHPLGALRLEAPGGRVSRHALAAAAAVVLPAARARLLAERAVAARAVPALPSVTVAVCTRERPELLARCLRALAAQQQDGLHVLVVDNAPATDATRRVAGAFANVRYVREDRQGLDFARNRALAECTADVLAHLDDDTVPCAHWVRAVRIAFANDPEVACVTGPVVADALDTPAQQQFELHGGFHRGFRARRFAAVTMAAVHHVLAPGVCGAGANMAFRRGDLARLGGFDPRLDAGARLPGGGDLDAFARVLRAGHVVRYEPRALVRHLHRADLPGLRRQIRSWGAGYAAFLCATFAGVPGWRWQALRAAAWWLLRYQPARFAGRLRGTHRAPWSLMLRELVGAIEGPFRLWRTHRYVRQVTR